MRAYKELETRYRRLSLIDEAQAMLGWDWATVMPEGSAASRAEQLAELSVISHEYLSDPRSESLLEEAETNVARLNAWQAANLSKMRRLWLHNAALPVKLVAEIRKATSSCELAWRVARSENNFLDVLPHFETVVALVREKSQAKAVTLALDPYDALLDEYEPGGRTIHIDPLFDDLSSFLSRFTDSVLEYQRTTQPPSTIKGQFAASKQRQLGKSLMKAIGFPFTHGRLDESHHPFSGGTPEDLRITTRYDEKDFTSALMAVLHETGHALYDHGLPERWRRQPVGGPLGMSIHESQSLLIEMQVCRSPEFIRSILPLIHKIFGNESRGLTAENLLRCYHFVRRDLIRVDADEVTYPSHVNLRYILEKMLISGELPPRDVPEAWRTGMRDIVGVELDSDDDSNGCLQDIHWYGGDFGYFPTYTLGALGAAQFFEAAKQQVPDLLESIERCDFKPLYDWLQTNIHSLGCSIQAPELVIRATGVELNTGPFKRHLTSRYLGS